MGNSRPLSEHLLFLYVMKALGDKFVEPFSSPIGESTFSTLSKLDSEESDIKFSSPIGESTFSTGWKGKRLNSCTVLFSSPIGESTFSTKPIKPGCRKHKGFRPLLGNLLSLRWTGGSRDRVVQLVFVPYWGIYFLYTNAAIKALPEISFRPLLGNLLSLQDYRGGNTEKSFCSFRPLLGNLLSLLNRRRDVKN